MRRPSRTEGTVSKRDMVASVLAAHSGAGIGGCSPCRRHCRASASFYPVAVEQAGETSGRRRPDSVLQDNLVVGLGTALSRLTGFIRFAVFGIIFGRTALWDAYNAANNSPNMIYELVLGGVLSATLVPVFTRFFADQDDEATGAVVSSSIVAVAGLTVVAVVASPWIFRLSSFRVNNVDAGDYRSLGASLARILLIQIFFYGLSAIWGALLNAKKRFFAPAWAPILSNVAIVVSLLVAKAQMNGDDGFTEAISSSSFRNTLAIGATVGIALQALAHLPALRSAGISVRFRPAFSHPAVRQVFRMSAWTIGYAAANIAAALVVQNLAKPGSGDASAYTLAYTFFQLPHALLAMSVLTTFMPDLAGSVKRADRPAFVGRMSLGVRIVALITVPAGFALFVLRRPIIGLLLEHGNFDAEDALVTSRALAGFALGLGGYSIYLFVMRGFYSHQDTRTPFTLNLVENVLNVVLAFALYPHFGVLGLGLAFAIAYIVTAAWALQILDYKVGGFELRRLFVSVGKTALAGLLMAETVWFAYRAVGSNTGTGALRRLVAAAAVGPVVYVGVMWLLGSEELRRARALVSARLSRAR